ncbi:MAG: hypothetical protein ACREVX_06235 [Clostridium sp.]|uniref:hypothetical protein n=1 Tax=Clostridium sp. TaxID=1506 RepID=UPI003D6CD97E
MGKEINTVEKKKNTLEKKKNPIRNSILSIKIETEVKQFYRNNLLYDHSDEKEKIKCLKKFSLNELKHLYSIIYISN